MRVVVTGASGLLGGAVARSLAERGDHVTVMQRRPSGLGLPEILGDVGDPAAVRGALSGADAVIHLAAKVNVVGPWQDYFDRQRGRHRQRRRGPRDRQVSRGWSRCPRRRWPTPAIRWSEPGPVRPTLSRPAATTAAARPLAEQLALAAARPGSVGRGGATPPGVGAGGHPTGRTHRGAGRARAGSALVGTGAALIDTTYVTNAADALIAALDRAPDIGGNAYVISNGEPRPVAEILAGICTAAGVPVPSRHVPFAVAWGAGAAVDTWWRWRGRGDDPPITRFLAEQLATAHWFDQRRTRDALQWQPAGQPGRGVPATPGAGTDTPGRRSNDSAKGPSAVVRAICPGISLQASLLGESKGNS